MNFVNLRGQELNHLVTNFDLLFYHCWQICIRGNIVLFLVVLNKPACTPMALQVFLEVFNLLLFLARH